MLLDRHERSGRGGHAAVTVRWDNLKAELGLWRPVMPAPQRVCRVELTPGAARALRKPPAEVRRRITGRIDALATQPRPADTTKIEGGEGLPRVRVGDYRIIDTVHDDVLLVLVVRIGHRRDIIQGQADA